MHTINLSFKVEKEVVPTWKKWMDSDAIPYLASRINGSSGKLHELMGHNDEYGETYVLQIHLPSQTNLEDYLKNHQKNFHEFIFTRWGESVLFFETVLKEIT